MIGALVFAFAAAISGWAWLQSGDLVHLVSGLPAAPRWINALALVGAVLLLVGLVLRFWPR